MSWILNVAVLYVVLALPLAVLMGRWFRFVRTERDRGDDLARSEWKERQTRQQRTDDEPEASIVTFPHPEEPGLDHSDQTVVPS